MAPLARDVMIAYTARAAGAAPAWAPLPVQYADYTLWQRELLGAEDDAGVAGRRAARLLDATTLGGSAGRAASCRRDRPRPAAPSIRGAHASTSRSTRDLHAGSRTLAREHDATLFMVVHAALAVLLSRLSGTDDIAIGTPIAGRGEAALDDLVGMFVNTLVLRTAGRRRPRRSPSCSRRSASTDLGAFAHADVPFERLVEVLDPARSTAHSPLFQVAARVPEHRAAPTLELPGLTVERPRRSTIDVAKFDLQLTLAENVGRSTGDAAGMRGVLAYATDLFDERTVARVRATASCASSTAVTADAAVPVGDIDVLERRTSAPR